MKFLTFSLTVLVINFDFFSRTKCHFPKIVQIIIENIFLISKTAFLVNFCTFDTYTLTKSQKKLNSAWIGAKDMWCHRKLPLDNSATLQFRWILTRIFRLYSNRTNIELLNEMKDEISLPQGCSGIATLKKWLHVEWDLFTLCCWIQYGWMACILKFGIPNFSDIFYKLNSTLK